MFTPEPQLFALLLPMAYFLKSSVNLVFESLAANIIFSSLLVFSSLYFAPNGIFPHTYRPNG